MEKTNIQGYITKYVKVIVIFILVFIVSIFYWNSRELIEPKIILPVNTISINHTLTKMKTILYWNTFFDDETMGFGLGSKIFENCSYYNCYATSNKTYIPTENFDAILFHGARYSAKSNGMPAKRHYHQKYIFYSMESPMNIGFDKFTQMDFYNLTMTYRRDSDIYRPYGVVVKSKTNYQLPSIQDIKRKTKKVAWFVSNCGTEGSKRRLNYAKELQKYIPVDIYGGCGTLKCNDREACYKMLEKDYKFYLSFENSMCKDYVTEKLFNVLNYNVIPIVLGFFSYNDVVPSNAIINTNDFRSPHELAKYLWKLDTDPIEYLKYFKWKKSFVVKDNTQDTICQMCEVLNLPINYFSYKNIKDWFHDFSCI